MNIDSNEPGRWRNMQELRKVIAPHANNGCLAAAITLHKLLASSLQRDDYSADPTWAKLVIPSPAGLDALTHAGLTDGDGCASADAMMALFVDFYHHEIYIDWNRCDLTRLRAIVDREIREGILLLPHRFGRHLYDKFNDEYQGERTDHLPPKEAIDLLDGTPQGVYQVGTMVSGPLGILTSSIKRFVPPSTFLPLWHCSDIGCRALHSVRVLAHDSDLQVCLAALRQSMSEKLGPCSEWDGAWTALIEPEPSSDPFTYRDLGPLIADSVQGSELTSLLLLALSGETGSRIRATLDEVSHDGGKGSAEAICKRLTDVERLQLLYVLRDEELVRLIDGAVKCQLIKVPSNEIRVTRNKPTSSAPTSELSSLGVRCSGENPLVDLCALVWDAYTSSDKLAELEWHLRSQTGGNSTQSALLVHLCQSDPTVAVKELVLSNGDVARFVANAIRCPIEEANDASFVDRVLWKLGFDIPRYSEPIHALRRRLDFFNQELLAVGTLSSERDRERIRSAGVNLFVSIEEFLQELVRYTVWVLASDHFLETQFTYSADEAMELVASTIGRTVVSGDVKVHWNTDGENTLGTLLVYLQATAHWIKTLLSSDRSQIARREADLPHFAGERFRIFPFEHVALWADTDYNSLKRISDQFEAVCGRVARSNLAGIRNGLDHHRDENNFPKIDQMLAFVAHFREGLDSAEASLFYPKEHWIESRVTDRYGRSTTTLVDYSGRQYKLFGPSTVHEAAVVSPEMEFAVLIAPGNPLGHANGELTFRVRKPSVYSAYWQNYPRHRKLPSPHRLLDEESTSTVA